VAVLDEDPQSISVLLGKGDGTFGSALVSPGGPAGRGALGYLTFADLNHDGNLDLAAAYANANMIAVLLGKGDGTFQPPKSYATGNNPTSIGVLPLADGSTALLTIDAITGKGILQFARSDGTLAAPPLYPIGIQHGFSGVLSSIAATDLNGDQIPDVVTYERSTGTVDVLIGSRGGTFQSPAAYALTDAGRASSPVPQHWRPAISMATGKRMWRCQPATVSMCYLETEMERSHRLRRPFSELLLQGSCWRISMATASWMPQCPILASYAVQVLPEPFGSC
jgi:FG-GAP-like repeat